MATLEAKAIEYPSSDGQPMAETSIHLLAIFSLLDQLLNYFKSRSETFVIADMFWYWEEGNPKSRVAPDIMVVPGVPQYPNRRSYFSWEERVTPAMVIEFASQGTWREDIEEKYDLYEELGVREYILFDPEGLYLVPVLQGYRLKGSTYRRIRPQDGVIQSELGFGFRAEDQILRMVNLETGERFLTGNELADVEQQKAEAERQKAEAEKSRADQLQAEVERLRAMLQQHGHTNGNGS